MGPLPGTSLRNTVWRNGLRLTIAGSNRPLKPADFDTPGSMITVIPEGYQDDDNVIAKAAVIIIKFGPGELTHPTNMNWTVDNIVAYSKICTHVGCPVALYEQTIAPHPVPVPPVHVRRPGGRHGDVRPGPAAAAAATHGRGFRGVPDRDERLPRTGRPKLLGAGMSTSNGAPANGQVSGQVEGPVEKVLGQTGVFLDDRLRAAKSTRTFLRKIFPDHWSFLLGEIALYSFIILLLTGTFLTLFFKPSMTTVVYHGVYTRLDGVRMSEAYASTLNISFDVRGGLLMRQIHHWAADLFMARDPGPHAADLLHRRVPQATRVQLADRHRAVHPGPAGRPVRLLAAGRPAVRDRAADHRGRRPGHPDRRHLPVVLPVRRAVPG